jgi:hypothetical protein
VDPTRELPVETAEVSPVLPLVQVTAPAFAIEQLIHCLLATLTCQSGAAAIGKAKSGAFA